VLAVVHVFFLASWLARPSYNTELKYQQETGKSGCDVTPQGRFCGRTRHAQLLSLQFPTCATAVSTQTTHDLIFL
jgi:hypothetical protein